MGKGERGPRDLLNVYVSEGWGVCGGIEGRTIQYAKRVR